MANVPAEVSAKRNIDNRLWRGNGSAETTQLGQISIPELSDDLADFLRHWPFPALHCLLASLSGGMRE